MGEPGGTTVRFSLSTSWMPSPGVTPGARRANPRPEITYAEVIRKAKAISAKVGPPVAVAGHGRQGDLRRDDRTSRRLLSRGKRPR
jgi:hypothetical protein